MPGKGKIRNFSLRVKEGFLEEVVFKLNPGWYLRIHLATC